MYTLVGKIINTHGVNGSVKIYPYTDDEKRFSELKSLYIGEKKIELNIEKVFYQKNLAIIKFSEFNNINEILEFKNSFVYIKSEDRVKLPANSFFIEDLIGLNVFNTKGDNLGILDDVLQYSANDVYVIKDLNQQIFYVPAVKEFIKEIDIDNKIIVIDPIEGMLN